MDIKMLLKGGGMAVSAIVAALYVCGWQYYLALFHAIGLDIHFFIPIQIGLGAGVDPVMTLLIVPSTISGLAGLVAAKFVKRWKPVAPSLCALSIASGLILPIFVKLVAGRWMGITMSWLEKSGLSFCGAWLAYFLFTLVFHYEMGEKPRYRWYAWSIVSLLLASALYGNIRGHSIAYATSHEKLARIVLSDETLQESYAGQLFAPLLEIDDYMIFVRFDPKDLDQHPEEHKLADGQVVFVKKSLIRTTEFKK